MIFAEKKLKKKKKNNVARSTGTVATDLNIATASFPLVIGKITRLTLKIKNY